MAEWPRYYRDSVLVFGHIHNRIKGDAFDYYLKHENMLNARGDINHYRPVTFKQLVENNKYFRENNMQKYHGNGMIPVYSTVPAIHESAS